MTDIGGDRSNDSFAFGVNDASVIVGCSGNAAVRWVDKRMQDLNTLIDPRSGWHLTCAKAINRRGIIAGYGSFRGDERVPFRLVPRRDS
jgi:uncharacterized membrane protein